MPYPCWGLKFSEPISDAKELIELMTDSRKDERWLLLGGPAAVSEGQLWTAWMGVGSRFQNDTMRANTVDVEFIRLIAGTHQIRIGFERAGISSSDEIAWLIHLRNFQWNQSMIRLANLDRHSLDREAERMTVLGATLLPHLPIPHAKTVERLELEIEPRSIEDYYAIERSACPHCSGRLQLTAGVKTKPLIASMICPKSWRSTMVGVNAMKMVVTSSAHQ